MANHWFYDEKDDRIHLRPTYPGHLVKSVYKAFDSEENITAVDLGSAVADFSKRRHCSSPAFIVIGPDSGNYYGYAKRDGEDWKFVLHQEATAGWLQGYRGLKKYQKATDRSRIEAESYRQELKEYQKAADKNKIEAERYKQELFELRCEFERAVNNNQILCKDLDRSRAEAAKLEANMNATLDEYHKAIKQCEVMGCRMEAMSEVLHNREEEIKKSKAQSVGYEALVEVAYTRKRTAMIWAIALLAAALVGHAVPKVVAVACPTEQKE